MPIQYKIRRGSTSEANSLTLTEGEIYMDLGDKTLRVYDGVTQGGTALAKKLDLNSKVDKINISAGTVGSGSQIPVIAYNSQGQITSVSTSTLNIPANIATESYVQTQISNLVDSSPSTLNTLKELATALGNDSNFATTIANQIGLKANTSSLAAVATSGNYNDLTNKPTIQSFNQSLNTTSNVTFNNLTLPGNVTSGLNVVKPTSSNTVVTISGDSTYTGSGGGQLKIRNAAGDNWLEAGFNSSTLTGFLQVYNVGTVGPMMISPDGGDITIGQDGFTTNIRTTLSLNGSSGTSGQVLKSNGTAKPSWLTLATVATSGSYNSLSDKLFETANDSTGLLALTTRNISVNGVRIGRGKNNIDGNTAVGTGTLEFNTTGSSLVALGQGSLSKNTTGTNNTAVGFQTLNKNTTGVFNTAVGADALLENTTGNYNSVFGTAALQNNTIGDNNTCIGVSSNRGNFNNSTGSNNTAIGSNTLSQNAGSGNTVVGYQSGLVITTGSKNTIVGSYTGNSNGLDIRTSNNNIVLSDGDGWPGLIIKNGVGTTLKSVASGAGTHTLRYNPTTGDVTYDTVQQFKTVNNQSIVGSGNVVAGGLGGMTAWFTRPNVTPPIAFSGTWTVPTGVTTIKVTLTSGGGGAGRRAVGRYSGGGSGSSIIAYVSVTPGSQISWTRGAAGLAGVNDGENGGNGGESNITVGGSQILRALGAFGGGQSFGGQGGQYIISTSSAIIGAIGVHGQSGGSVPNSGGSINEYGSATGTSSIWGGGSQFYNSEGDVTLRHGTGGAAGSGQGRPGGDGVVIIEW